MSEQTARYSTTLINQVRGFMKEHNVSAHVLAAAVEVILAEESLNEALNPVDLLTGEFLPCRGSVSLKR